MSAPGVLTIALKHLLAAGLSNEQIIAAMGEMEQAAGKDVAADRRREKDRIRKRAKAGIPQNSAESEESADDAETLPPPPSSPKPPTTPTPIRECITTHARQADFAAFWLAYPLKTGKGAAEKAFAKAISQIGGPDPGGVLMGALQAIKARWAATDSQFIPHASTWLNQRRWEDEPEPPNNPPPRPPNVPVPSAKLAAKQANWSRSLDAARGLAGAGTVERDGGFDHPAQSRLTG